MGVFANVYAGHHCIYGENTYHPADIEVVDFGKLFRLQIDQELSKEQKLKGERKAVIEAIGAFSYEQAMQLFLDINRALYRKEEFFLTPGLDPGMSGRLEKMGLRNISDFEKRFKVKVGTLMQLIEHQEKPGMLAIADGREGMSWDDIDKNSRLVVGQYNGVSYNLTSRLSGSSLDEVGEQLEKIDDIFERMRVK